MLHIGRHECLVSEAPLPLVHNTDVLKALCMLYQAPTRAPQVHNIEACARHAQAVQFAQIQVHEAVLAPVVSAFRQVDRTASGVLSAGDFASFCRLLNSGIPDQEIEALLSTLTPNGEQTVRQYWCRLRT